MQQEGREGSGECCWPVRCFDGALLGWCCWCCCAAAARTGWNEAERDQAGRRSCSSLMARKLTKTHITLPTTPATMRVSAQKQNKEGGVR